jgi:CRP-like cAMP-binding protein
MPMTLPHLDHLTASRGERLEVLGQVGWLSRRPADFQAQIARIGRWRRVSAGEVLYLAGDESEWIVGLAEGVLDY